MNWAIFSGVACMLAIGLLTTAILQHGGVRSVTFYSLSLVSSAFAYALADSFVGFQVTEFYVDGLWIHPLYVPPVFYPDTILLLLLFLIFTILGGCFHWRKRRKVRQPPV